MSDVTRRQLLAFLGAATATAEALALACRSWPVIWRSAAPPSYWDPESTRVPHDHADTARRR